MKNLTAFAAVALGVFCLGCATTPQPSGKEAGKVEEDKRPTKKVTMMSYNIRTGFGDEKQGWYRFPPNFLGYLPQVARVIRETKPTWVAIQEVDNGMHRTGFVDQMDVLGTLTEMKGYFMDKTNFGEPQGHYGLGLLLKKEPVSMKKIELGGSGKDHPRILFAAEMEDAIVCTTHFSLRRENRLNAVEVIKREFANSTKPVIIAGDFNVDQDSPELRSLGEAFTALNPEGLPTWPSHEPYADLDHIFIDNAHSNLVKVLSVTTPDIDLCATDHRPLVIKAEFITE